MPRRARAAALRAACSGARVSGFTSILSQAGGPPFSVHVLPQRLEKMTLVGTITIFFAVVNPMRIVPYFALGQFYARNLTISLVLLPLAIAANSSASGWCCATPTELFYRIAYTLMFCSRPRCCGRALSDCCAASYHGAA